MAVTRFASFLGHLVFSLSFSFLALNLALAQDQIPVILTTVTRTRQACPASSSTTPPAATLTPVLHWDIDLYDLGALQPTNAIYLYYHGQTQTLQLDGSAEPTGTGGVPFAQVNVPESQYSAVQIDHSSYATLICSPDNATITFNNPAAYQLAAESWTTQPDGILIVTRDPSCTNAEGEHAYLLVQHMDLNDPDMTINGGITVLNFTDAVGNVNTVVVSFGQVTLPTATGSNLRSPPSSTPVQLGDLNGSENVLLMPNNDSNGTLVRFMPQSGNSTARASMSIHDLLPDETYSFSITVRISSFTNARLKLFRKRQTSSCNLLVFADDILLLSVPTDSLSEQYVTLNSTSFHSISGDGDLSYEVSCADGTTLYPVVDLVNVTIVSNSNPEPSLITVVQTVAETIVTETSFSTLEASTITVLVGEVTTTHTSLLTLTIAGTTIEKTVLQPTTIIVSETTTVSAMTVLVTSVEQLNGSTITETSIVPAETYTLVQTQVITLPVAQSSAVSGSESHAVVVTMTEILTLPPSTSIMTVPGETVNQTFVTTIPPTTEYVTRNNTYFHTQTVTQNFTATTTVESTAVVTDLDQQMDVNIGFADMTDPDAWRSLSLNTYNVSMNITQLDDAPEIPVVPLPEQNSLRKRGAFGTVQSLYRFKLYDVVQNMKLLAADLNSTNTYTIEELAVASGKSLERWNPRAYTPLSGFVSFDSGLTGNYYNNYQQNTEWGTSWLLQTSGSAGSLYCVECQSRAQFAVTGVFNFTPLTGPIGGYAHFEGVWRLDLALGINATSAGVISHNYNTSLPTYYTGYQGIMIPAVLYIYPYWSIYTGGRAQIYSPGEGMAGATFEYYPIVTFTISDRDQGGVVAKGFDNAAITPIFGDSSSGLRAAGEVWTRNYFQFEYYLYNSPNSGGYRYIHVSEESGLYLGAGSQPESSVDFAGIPYELGDASCSGLNINVRPYNNHSYYYYRPNSGTTVWSNTTNTKFDNLTQCYPSPGTKLARSAEDAQDLTERAVKKRELTPGGTFYRTAQISNLNSTLLIHYANNGNLYAVPTNHTVETPGLDRSTIFSTDYYCGYGGYVMGDTAGRVMYAYKDTVREHGVSRLRMAKLSKMPNTAFFVAFAPLSLKSGSEFSTLGIADMNGTAYYPTACVYSSGSGLYPKLFLSNDTVDGPAKLMDPALSADVTGGNVTTCAPIKLTNGYKYGLENCGYW